MAVTIQEVAERAGVSIGTVSRYVNGAHLREQNRLNIEQAIEELGFKTSVSAIAVFVPVLTSIFAMSIVTEIERIVMTERYNSIICDFENSYTALQERLKFFKNRAISGIVLFPLTQRDNSDSLSIVSLLEEYAVEQIPIVVVDEILPGFETDAVLVDNAHASFRAVEHLIHHKHRDIAILSGRKNSFVSQERLRGYVEALQTYKIPVEEKWIKWGDFRTKGGYAAVKELFHMSDRPTALYSTNHNMTLGATTALNELQIKIPEELSLVGFDRFASSDVIRPPLTLVEQPLDEIGKAAGELMIQRIRGDYTDFPQKIKLNTRLLVRNSVCTFEEE
ncbi:MAG: LacI family transcriptional regulator [bacterium]|nr:LacI family transcriptional regulator [bacterium]